MSLSNFKSSALICMYFVFYVVMQVIIDSLSIS